MVSTEPYASSSCAHQAGGMAMGGGYGYRMRFWVAWPVMQPVLLWGVLTGSVTVLYLQVVTSQYGPRGYDRVRNYEIGEKNVQLKHLEEAFTSEHWIVRIYKVLKPENRQG